ncbi:MAG TPA: riboflavin biosynthesis protein RibF [Opitutaceae bacterium]
MSAGSRVFSSLEEVRLANRPLHVAVGMFDGVHRGHRLVIESAVEAARHASGLSGVLTFWPHPSRLFRPDDPTRLIFDNDARRELLSQVHVDFIIEQPFTRDFASVEADDFIQHVRRSLPSLDTLYVGENWRFGRGRRGDVSLLVKLAREVKLNVVSVDRLHFNGEPVSSTRIRGLIEAGDVESAQELLGFRYFATGVVIPGRQLGRTINVPTLNLDWQPDLRPALGVYAVRVRRSGETALLSAVANYGVRPTVDGQGAPLLEVHILGECPFGTGDRLHVDWCRRLRGEERFESLDALRAQVDRDRVAAAQYFAAAVRVRHVP